MFLLTEVGLGGLGFFLYTCQALASNLFVRQPNSGTGRENSGFPELDPSASPTEWNQDCENSFPSRKLDNAIYETG